MLWSVWAWPWQLALSAGRTGSRGPRLCSTQLCWASSPPGPSQTCPRGVPRGPVLVPPGASEASPVLPAAGLGSRGCLGPRCPVSDATPSPPLPASLPFLPGQGMVGQPSSQRSHFRDAQGAALRYPLVPNLDIFSAQWQRRCQPPAQTGGLRKPLILLEMQSSHKLPSPSVRALSGSGSPELGTSMWLSRWGH